MRHDLKINECFADAIADGRKRFEVRENDRGFQAGDTVVFQVVDGMRLPVRHPINGLEWRVTYVLSGWGIATGHVVFGFKEES